MSSRLGISSMARSAYSLALSPAWGLILLESGLATRNTYSGIEEQEYLPSLTQTGKCKLL